MPHRDGESRHAHLPLRREDFLGERRKRKGRPGAAPERGTRPEYAARLNARLQVIQAAALQLAETSGVEPHLVFRVPFATGVATEDMVVRLEEAGLSVVSVEPDRAIIAFRDDTSLDDFHQAVARYEAGPQEGKKSTKWDLLEYIEAERLAPLEPRDRIGARLREEIGPAGERIDDTRAYVLEIELWHPGDTGRARGFLSELRGLIESAGPEQGRLTDSYVGEGLCLAKARLRGDLLRRVLASGVVAEVERPTIPMLDIVEVRNTTAFEFPVPPAPDPDTAPRLCIIDSGVVTAHPLLANNIGHAEAILTGTDDPADANGHGTRVAGVAIFGDVRKCFEARNFESPILLFSARVLNDRNEFDDERLLINQMRGAVEAFHRPPYNCRIFNISIGDRVASKIQHGDRQSRWAEALDVLAREMEVLFVVSSGNNEELMRGRGAEAERVLTEWPRYLFETDAGIAAPSTAAIALTVGAIAEHDTVAQALGAGAEDLVRAIAPSGHPAPYTRVGPGVNGAIKPEFIGFGGNAVFKGFGDHRSIGTEEGTALMSCHREPLTRLFDFDYGTSYAAPQVARIAALTWSALERHFGRTPHPNSVRAVLASAAFLPPSVDARLSECAPDAVLCALGYGFPDEDLATSTGDSRVTLVAEGAVPLDAFHIYELPVPDEFRHAPGRKEITIALAFDPPVRGRRADYLGVEMQFELIRGSTLEEISDAFRKLRPDEDAIRLAKRLRPSLSPPATGTRGRLGRKRSTLQKASFTFSAPGADYGDTYHIVVRSDRKRWLPATIEEQRYAIAVVLQGASTELYNRLRQRITQPMRVRVR